MMRNVSNKWGAILWGFGVVVLGGVVFLVFWKILSLSCSNVEVCCSMLRVDLSILVLFVLWLLGGITKKFAQK